MFIVSVKLSRQPVLLPLCRQPALLHPFAKLCRQPALLFLCSKLKEQQALLLFCVKMNLLPKLYLFCVKLNRQPVPSSPVFFCVRLNIQPVLLLLRQFVQTASPVSSFSQVVQTTFPVSFCVPDEQTASPISIPCILFPFCVKLYSLSALLPPSVKLATHISTA